MSVVNAHSGGELVKDLYHRKCKEESYALDSNSTALRDRHHTTLRLDPLVGKNVAARRQVGLHHNTEVGHHNHSPAEVHHTDRLLDKLAVHHTQEFHKCSHIFPEMDR